MLTNKMYNIYDRCLKRAEKSVVIYRHGCIATYGGKIIATGNNTEKYDKSTCTCHAEVNVLNKLYTTYCRKQQKEKILKIFKKTTLYVSRLSQGGFSETSAPCVHCLEVIKHYKIKKIIFNINNNYVCINPHNYLNPKYSDGHKYINICKKI